MASSAAAFADNLVNLGALAIDDHGTIPGTMTKVEPHHQLKVHGKTFAISSLVNMVSAVGITGLVKAGVGLAAVLAVGPTTITGAALAVLAGWVATKAVDIGGELVHDLRLRFDNGYKPKEDHKPRKGGIGKMLVNKLPFTKNHSPTTKACMAAAIDVAFLVAVEMNVIGGTLFLNAAPDTLAGLLTAAGETAVFAAGVGVSTFGLSAAINKVASLKGAKASAAPDDEEKKPGWLGIGLKTVSALALAYVAGKIGAENLEHVMSLIGTFLPNMEAAVQTAEGIAQTIEHGGMAVETVVGASAGLAITAAANLPKLLPLGAKPAVVALEPHAAQIEPAPRAAANQVPVAAARTSTAPHTLPARRRGLRLPFSLGEPKRPKAGPASQHPSAGLRAPGGEHV